MAHSGSWTSAIAPQEPPVPRPRHWAAGLTAASALLVLAAILNAPADLPQGAQQSEAVVVALGGAAQRLEAVPENVTTTDQPAVVGERADDSPPVAAPPQERQVAAFSQGEGRLSSGTGAGAGTGPALPLPPTRRPPPPPRAPAAPPPAPAEPPPLSQTFRLRSTGAYMDQVVYPAASLRREESGIGVLRVTIARDGRVLDARLVRSTGHERLDAEILRVAAIVRQLDPLPADYPAQQGVADLNIAFVLEYMDAR